MATTSCARCLVLPCRNVLEHACSLPPSYMLLSRMYCVYLLGVWPLRPATDAWKHPVGISLSMRVHCLPPTCCFLYTVTCNTSLVNWLCIYLIKHFSYSPHFYFSVKMFEPIINEYL